MKRVRAVIHRLSKGVTSEKLAITRDVHVEGKRRVYPTRTIMLPPSHHRANLFLGNPSMARYMDAFDDFPTKCLYRFQRYHA
jgi:hypothetical protein